MVGSICVVWRAPGASVRVTPSAPLAHTRTIGRVLQMLVVNFTARQFVPSPRAIEAGITSPETARRTAKRIFMAASDLVRGKQSMDAPPRVVKGACQRVSVPVSAVGGAVDRRDPAGPYSKVGSVRFTHDGLPGAIHVKANQANFALSPPFIEVVPFEAVRVPK
jgi:hypothetical protein